MSTAKRKSTKQAERPAQPVKGTAKSPYYTPVTHDGRRSRIGQPLMTHRDGVGISIRITHEQNEQLGICAAAEDLRRSEFAARAVIQAIGKAIASLGRRANGVG